MSSSPEGGAEPKIMSAITIGPMVVPKELIPPAKLRRWEPVSGSPKAIAKGLAAVCCKENPKPTINNANKTK